MFLSKIIVGSFAYERALAQRGTTERKFHQMTAMMYYHNEASYGDDMTPGRRRNAKSDTLERRHVLSITLFNPPDALSSAEGAE